MTKQKILLIQSEYTMGNGTKHHLEEGGYQVIVAGSGLLALTMARNTVIDLILLDVALPDIQGLDLCRTFRQRSDTRSIPIILFTTRGYTPDRKAAGGFGPDDYLAKPYSEKELDERIASVLKSRAPETVIEPEHNAPRTSGPTTDQEPGAEQPSLQETEAEPSTIALHEPGPDQKPSHGAERESRTEDEPASAASPASEHSTEQKTVLAPMQQANSQEAPSAVEPGSESAQATALNLKEAVDQASAPSQGPAPNAKPAESAEPDSSQPSSLLPITGTGDVVDPATGLFGRPQFEAMFSKEFKRATRFKQQLSLMLINLDGRKRGQTADGNLVKSIIALIQKTIREVDTAAWWSGEAFIVLLPNTIRNDALQAAARVLEAVALYPFTWPDATRITVNIGVAGLPDKNIDSERKLLEAAGAACERAQELMTPPPFDIRMRR
ncbi:MAG TPA: response regulator [Nitrospirota bacterium]